MKDEKTRNGFTLVELMIVVVLVSVLAAMALPVLTGNILKARRAIAKTVLLEVQAREEQYFLDNKAYGDVLSDLDSQYTSPLYIDDNGAPSVQADAYYKISVSLPAAFAYPVAFAYVVVAEPVNAQMADTDCGSLRLHSTGLKEASGAKGAAGCW